LRFDDIENHLADPPKPVEAIAHLDGENDHFWKFIAFGPDGKLYFSVGAPCNICEPDPVRYANIMRVNPDGTELQTVAHGIRCPVGFDWDPQTKELWFTVTGRDFMGDELPPDTLNHAAKAGLDFGFPYCHAGNVPDPAFGKKRACSEFAQPDQRLPAHVTP